MLRSKQDCIWAEYVQSIAVCTVHLRYGKKRAGACRMKRSYTCSTAKSKISLSSTVTFYSCWRCFFRPSLWILTVSVRSEEVIRITRGSCPNIGCATVALVNTDWVSLLRDANYFSKCCIPPKPLANEITTLRRILITVCRLDPLIEAGDARPVLTNKVRSAVRHQEDQFLTTASGSRCPMLQMRKILDILESFMPAIRLLCTLASVCRSI